MKKYLPIIILCMMFSVCSACTKSQAENKAYSTSNQPSTASSTNAPNMMETTASDNYDAFYGSWKITKIQAWHLVSDRTEDEARFLTGKVISYSKDRVTSEHYFLEYPYYQITKLSKDDFDIHYKIRFKDLGVNSDSILVAYVYKDEQYEDIWYGDGYGYNFFIKDSDTLIFDAGFCCYEMKRIS